MRLGRYGLNEVDDVEDVASDIEVDIEVDIDVDIEVDDVDDVYGSVCFLKADNLELVILKKRVSKIKRM